MSLYIFDKDNTLIAFLGNRPANTPQEQVILPGVLDKIKALRAQGHKIAIASNQGGVAWEFITYAQADALLKDCARKIGGAAYAFSPYDPKAAGRRSNAYARADESRKPRPGMLRALMQRLGYNAKNTIMVGDSEDDRQAAEAAGIRFILASKFFGGDQDD